jgi:hypothetical protein
MVSGTELKKFNNAIKTTLVPRAFYESTPNATTCTLQALQISSNEGPVIS